MPDYQLSLAIGREGQNARLAARLTGWRIDIRSDNPSADNPAADEVSVAEVSDADVSVADVGDVSAAASTHDHASPSGG